MEYSISASVLCGSGSFKGYGLRPHRSRHAGWIALGSGWAGCADVILIPEVAFQWDHSCQQFLKRGKRGGKFNTICAAGGRSPAEEDIVADEQVSKRTDLIRLGGIVDVVGAEITELSGVGRV